MSIEKVVINASPFILLCKCGLIELLPQLFLEIEMPESVSEEIIRGADIASDCIYDCEKTWLSRCLAPHSKEVLAWNLGDGETEVLSVVSANKETYTALVDDRAARKCALALGINTLGTAGILILAKKRGLIPAVLPELHKLRDAGMWLPDETFSVILNEAGELK